jgi:hypothetical protein
MLGDGVQTLVCEFGLPKLKLWTPKKRLKLWTPKIQLLIRILRRKIGIFRLL